MSTILKVNIKTICYDSYQSPEPYGEWREACSNSLESVNISEEKYGEAVHYDAKVGQEVFVLWAEYSSGDSFGYGDRNNTDVIYVFNNIEYANAAKEALTKVEKYNYNKTILVDVDKSFDYYIPWTGYFEILDEIHITPMKIS